MNAIESGRRALTIEGEAVLAAANRLDARFERAIELLADAERVIVSGIGKSGAVAQKIASTLTSTGTWASWLHPVDALHGDLGLVRPGSAAIIISKSGETDELVGLLHALARLDIPVIAITGAADSTLGRAAAVVLDGAVRVEACPHDLAPTASTTVALALGDALAVALLERRGFTQADFAAVHPGGRLGRRLLLRVVDVMVPPVHLLPSSARMREVIVCLARGRGLAVIVDNGLLVGVISAGDLTRIAEQNEEVLDLAASDVMTRSPQVTRGTDLGATVVGQMERKGIAAAPVLDQDERVIGVVHLHDLLRAGAA